MSDVKIEINPKAAESFNQKAQEIFSLIRPVTLSQDNKQYFSPDLHVTTKIKESDIIDSISSETAKDNDIILKIYFKINGQQFGIDDGDHKLIGHLIDNLVNRKEFRELVSKETTQSILLKWLRLKYANQIICDFMDYFIDELITLTDEYEVWIPIKELHLQTNIRIGQVILQPITKEFIKDLKQKHLAKSLLTDRESVEKFYEVKMQPLQGHTASTFKIKCEPNRAREITIEKTYQALAVLRFFSIASLKSRIINSYDIWGSFHKKTETALLLNNQNVYNFYQSNIEVGAYPEILDNQKINFYLESGLQLINTILSKPSMTDLEKDVIKSITRYSKATVTPNLDDKLLYILVSLESLLIKDDKEAITQNLGERIAFLIGKDINERKTIISIVKQIYGFRSKFVHHGASIDQYEIIDQFMMYAWSTIITILDKTQSLDNRMKLIDSIDDRKLS